MRLLLLALVASRGSALVFTESNGQIFTPGFAVLDAPQPGTPLGGGKCEHGVPVFIFFLAPGGGSC